MGHVGIIMGLEVSGLALNYWNVNPGWRHGLFDPTHFKDMLLLGA